jgi:hypothetical protein
MKRHKHKTNKLFKYISDSAIHIWVVIILANVLLLYTFHFYIHAATDPTKLAQNASPVNQNADAIPTEDTSPPTMVPEPTDDVPATPAGPRLGLSFTVPGIGSGGGNLKPIHPTRNVIIYLYPTGVNALDKKIRPINTIKTKAYYDANPDSATYTQFLNPRIDLGAAVNDGDYQIILQTDYSFRTLIKEKPDSVGGVVYSLVRQTASTDDFNRIPLQTLLVGDLYPVGAPDNVADLGDYDVLTNCYHLRQGTPKCPNPYMADLNDDGIVDGLDYNVMILTFKGLKEQGFSVPQLVIPPTDKKVTRLSHLTPAVTKKPMPSPTKAPEKQANSGGGFMGILILLMFLAGLGGGGFFLYLKNPKVRGTIDAMIHKSPVGPSPLSPNQPQATQPAASNHSTSSASNAATPGSTPTAASDAGSQADAKEYYVKKQSDDDTKTGFWLTLTDDNGPTLAHYKGAAVTDGFAKIKGAMKTENSKTFLEISELTPEA